MRRSTGPRKTPLQLSESAQHLLNMYAVAACAAGVGALALAQPAHAKIVYTPDHLVIPPGLDLGFDVNRDGFDDFQIRNSYIGNRDYHSAWLNAWGNFTGDAVEGHINSFSSSTYAYALLRGAKIGPSRQFGAINMLGVTYLGGVVGQWNNVKARYLGLRLQIKGKIHYGWARVNVKRVKYRITATLTGYAYETIPNKPIIAGKIKDTNSENVGIPEAAVLAAPAPEPRTLGCLAQGAEGLVAWRKKDDPLA